MKILDKFNLKEILKFCVGGGSAVITDYAIYALLSYLGVETWAAKTVSYIAGAVVGFVINKLWTFESKKFRSDEMIKYILLYVFSAGVNSIVNSLILKLFDIRIVAFLAATGTSTIINFLGQKFFVFRKSEG